MFGRLLILLFLIALVDIYSWQAIRMIINEGTASIGPVLTITFWLLTGIAVSYLLSVISGLTRRIAPALVAILRSFVLIAYFSKFLVAVIMFVDDVRRLVITAINATGATDLDVSRSMTAAWAGVILGAGMLILLTYGMLRNPYRYKVFRKKLRHSQLHKDLHGLRLVQISDIHAGSFYNKAKVARSVKMINALQPDLVFFTGDLVNSRSDEINPYIEIFRGINSTYGVYSITGNHDYGDYYMWDSEDQKRDNFRELIEKHAELEWKLLLNAHAVVEVRAARLAVIGVENYSTHPRFQKYGDLSKAVNSIGEVDYQILLSHDPTHFDAEVVTEYPGINLTLSGHTHGFQFGIEVGEWFRWSPIQYVYKKWAGLYRQGKQYLYVNRGLGFLGYPGRVGILPEITCLTLEKES